MEFDWQIIPVAIIFGAASYYLFKRFFMKKKSSDCGADCGCAEGIKFKS